MSYFLALLQLLKFPPPVLCQLQSVHLQESLPGQHLCPVPALGVQPGLRSRDRGPRPQGAAAGRQAPGLGVREICPGVSVQAEAESEDALRHQPRPEGAIRGRQRVSGRGQPPGESPRDRGEYQLRDIVDTEAEPLSLALIKL